MDCSRCHAAKYKSVGLFVSCLKLIWTEKIDSTVLEWSANVDSVGWERGLRRRSKWLRSCVWVFSTLESNIFYETRLPICLDHNDASSNGCASISGQWLGHEVAYKLDICNHPASHRILQVALGTLGCQSRHQKCPDLASCYRLALPRIEH